MTEMMIVIKTEGLMHTAHVSITDPDGAMEFRCHVHDVPDRVAHLIDKLITVED